MSTEKTLHGNSVTVPAVGDTNWGANVGTGILVPVIDGVDATTYKTGSNTFAKTSPADSTLASSATLTPTSSHHRVQGSGGAVILDSTTAIADGSVDGQILFLEGAHSTNTVEVEDGANVDLPGGVVLGLGSETRSVTLVWNSSRSVWVKHAGL